MPSSRLSTVFILLVFILHPYKLWGIREPSPPTPRASYEDITYSTIDAVSICVNYGYIYGGVKKRFFNLDFDKLRDECKAQVAKEDLCVERRKALYLSLTHPLLDLNTRFKFTDFRIAQIEGAQFLWFQDHLYVGIKNVENLDVKPLFTKLEHAWFKVLTIDGLLPEQYLLQEGLLCELPSSVSIQEEAKLEKIRKTQRIHASSQIAKRVGLHHLIPEKKALKLCISQDSKQKNISLPWKIRSSYHELSQEYSSFFHNCAHFSNEQKKLDEKKPLRFTSELFLNPDGTKTQWLCLHYFAFEDLYTMLNSIKLFPNQNVVVLDLRKCSGGDILSAVQIMMALSSKPIDSISRAYYLSPQFLQEVQRKANVLSKWLDEYKLSAQFQKPYEKIGFDRRTASEELIVGLLSTYIQILEQAKNNQRFSTAIPLLGVKVFPPRAPTFQKLVVLTSHKTQGCAELIAAMLKDAQAATIIGETTAGSSSETDNFKVNFDPLIQELQMSVSLDLRAQGKLIENLGVEPDILLDPFTLRQDPQDLYKELQETLIHLK